MHAHTLYNMYIIMATSWLHAQFKSINNDQVRWLGGGVDDQLYFAEIQ